MTPEEQDKQELARHKAACANAVEYRGYKIVDHGNGRQMVYPPRTEQHSLSGCFTCESVDEAKRAIDADETEAAS